MDDLDQRIEQYHAGLVDFVHGDPAPVLKLFSKRDDVVLCNPFRPFAHGPAEVAETTGAAASHFSDGEYAFETIEKFVTPELGYIIEIERFKAKLDGNESSGSLRVTTIFRAEGDGWRISHRHADPITTPQTTQSIVQK